MRSVVRSLLEVLKRDENIHLLVEIDLFWNGLDTAGADDWTGVVEKTR